MGEADTLTAAGLVSLAQTAPQIVRHECSRRLTGGANDATLHLALAWAAFTQGDTTDASIALDAARREGCGPVELARLETALLLEQGRTAEAHSRLAALIADRPEDNCARLWSGLGGMHASNGDHEAALSSYNRGLTEARRWSDRGSEYLLLNNRALSTMARGDFSLAHRDLLLARAAGVRLADQYLYAISTHNLGSLASQEGDLPAALSYFQEARELFESARDQVSLAHALTDQSAALLEAGLLDEALALAQHSLERFAAIGAESACADAEMQMARIHVAAGRWADAADMTARCLQRCARAGLGPAHFHSAQQLEHTCGLVLGASSPEVSEITPDLTREVAVDAALVLVTEGRDAEAVQLLAGLVDPPRAAAAGGADAPTRLLDAVAHAAHAALSGRPDAAHQTVIDGLQDAHDFALVLGVHDLRASTNRRVRQLAEVGIREAVRSNDPARVVQLLESARTVTLLPEPELSVDERRLVGELRAVVSTLATHAAKGDHPDPNVADRLRRQRIVLERQLAQRRRSHGSDVPRRPPTRGEAIPPAIPPHIPPHIRPDKTPDTPAHRPLGASVYVPVYVPVYVFVLDGVLCAVTNGPSPEIITVADFADVNRVLTGLRITLSSLAGDTPGLTIEPAVNAVREILAPLLSTLDGDEQLSVVMDPMLGFIPWALLTPVPVAIVTSAAELVAVPPRSGVAGEPVMIVGPGLEHAETEARAVSQHYGALTLLAGDAASTANATRQFGEADLIHVSSHGTFRSDNPLFSALHLADGPLTFFDLLDGAAPRRLILSACDVGQQASNSAVGLATMLSTRGTRGLICCCGPVNDAGVVELMDRIHRHLADGATAAVALRRAQQALIATSPALAMFGAFGSA